jgi:hypothetical protein
MSKNIIVKKCLDEYLKKDKKEKMLTFKESFDFLIKYININKKIPHRNEKYENVNIGMWLHAQKNKIKSNKDIIYIKMTENKIIKECLDEYLKKEKILTFDKTLEILVEYANINKKMPTSKEKYKNVNIGIWLTAQKGKIKNDKNDTYIKMSKNEIIKDCLNKYLKKEKILTFEESFKILLEYVNINKKIPAHREIYKNVNIGQWLGTKKNKINSNLDDIYIKMSTNVTIKKCLDDYLKKETVKNLTFDETSRILLEYVKIYNKTPVCKEKYKNINIGQWFKIQKSKIKNDDNDIYKKLSKNDVIKKSLDNNLRKKI